MLYPDDYKGVFVEAIFIPELYGVAQNQHDAVLHSADASIVGRDVSRVLFTEMRSRQFNGHRQYLEEVYGLSLDTGNGYQTDILQKGVLGIGPRDVEGLIHGLHRQAASLMVSAWASYGTVESAIADRQAAHKILLAYGLHAACAASRHSPREVPSIYASI